ncbi:MAG: L-ribulose-5-phosphate 3-epimerase [Treponema sp.]|nr:L-ribulose-5-phosphate 3-epimerase [Treponema sp.]
MKIYQLGLYEKSMSGSLSLSEKLHEARIAGYDYLELSIDESDEKLSRLDWGKDEIGSLHSAMTETGVPIKSICLSGHRRFPLGDPDPDVRQKSMDIMEKALVLASRLGIRLIQIAGYDVYYKTSSKETENYFAENLEKSVHLAAREGVILAFETMETPFIDTVGKAAYWVNKISSPYLQIYPDTGNITNAALIYGSPVKEDLEKGRGHIAALHLKESKPGVYREVPYGEGHVNFKEAIQTAWAMGVRLYVAEFWFSSRDDSWRNTLQKNCAFLRNILNGQCK